MDITKLSLTELKAVAYDEITRLEQAQNNLKLINQEILKRTTSEAKKDLEAAVEEESSLADNAEVV